MSLNNLLRAVRLSVHATPGSVKSVSDVHPELLICNFTKYIVIIQSFEQQVQLLVSLYQLTLFG